MGNKKKELDFHEEVDELKKLSKDKLIEKKYWYIQKAKSIREYKEMNNQKTFIITIFLALITIVTPLLYQFTTNHLNLEIGNVSSKIEAIKQKEISDNKKSQEIEMLSNEFYEKGGRIPEALKKLHILISTSLAIQGTYCLYLAFSIRTRQYNILEKAIKYEILIEYIDKELIKNAHNIIV